MTGDAENDPGDPSGGVDPELAELIIESILRSIAREMVLRGEVDTTAMTLEELRSLARQRLSEAVEDDQVGFDLVVDHSATILADARSHAQDGREEYAFVFYGLYVEHTLNRAIRDRALQLDLSERETLDILRKSLPDKTGITWKLLFGSGFPDDIRVDLVFVAERRNSFIHYKWQANPTSRMTPEEVRRRRSDALDTAERAVGTLTGYVNRLVGIEDDGIGAWIHRTEPPEGDR